MQALLLQVMDNVADEVVFETTELVVKEEVHTIANEHIKQFSPFTEQWADEIAGLKSGKHKGCYTACP